MQGLCFLVGNDIYRTSLRFIEAGGRPLRIKSEVLPFSLIKSK